MALDKLRYSLTDYKERIFMYSFENFKLLIHPSTEETERTDRKPQSRNVG